MKTLDRYSIILSYLYALHRFKLQVVGKPYAGSLEWKLRDYKP